MTQALNLANLANSINSSGQLAGSAVNGAVASATNATNATNLTGGTCTIGTTQLGAGNASIMKNRIINGAMVIDQRNAGASITPTTYQYTVDRWVTDITQSSKFTVQQNAGSVTPPAGFTNYLGITSTSAYTQGAGDFFNIAQIIEGYNTADLNWGSANAKTVTLSFWVRSSLTGTFGGTIRSSNAGYCYPFSYSIPVANTWTQISLTIIGPTTGAFNTLNNNGPYIAFCLGIGTTYAGAAGSWQSSNYLGATGCVNVLGTNGATFYITGVQLEVGSSATGFEYRQYQQELALCQRYFETSYAAGTAIGTATQTGIIWTSQMQATTTSYIGMSYTWKVQKRTAPTVTAYDKAGTSGTVTRWTLGAGETDGSNYSLSGVSDSTWQFFSSGSSNSAGLKLHFAATAEL